MPYQRILVINLNQIGAVMLATPVFTCLKDAFPNARVATLVRDSMRPLLFGNPWLDEVIGWDMRWPLSRRLQVIRSLRRQRYDVAINLSHALERSLLARLSGAPLRIGFNTAEASFLHNRRVIERQNRTHAAERNLDLVRALGIEADGRREGLRMFVLEEDRQWLAGWANSVGLRDEETLITLNPGASNDAKKWPHEHFARLADMLAARGHRLALLGAAFEQADADAILRLTRADVIPLTGRLNLRQLGAVIARSRVLVTNDTGPMHMAIGLRVPSVCLFGSSDPLWHGPYSGDHIVLQKEELPCIRCHKAVCPTQKECMVQITPEEALAAVETLLSRAPAGSAAYA